jgi:hypothetical protein
MPAPRRIGADVRANVVARAVETNREMSATAEVAHPISRR